MYRNDETRANRSIAPSTARNFEVEKLIRR